MLDCSFAYAGCSAAICYAVSFVALQKKVGKSLFLSFISCIFASRFEHFAAEI